VTSEEYQKSSRLWYLVPIFLGIIGGLIAYLILKKEDTKLAKRCLIVGIIITIIPLITGSGVVLYGTSLYQGETQRESITVSDAKLWVHATDAAGITWGAVGIKNTGDKVISVDTIQVRGIDVPHSQWYSDTTVSDTLFRQALIFPGWDILPQLLKTGSCVGNPNYLCVDNGGSLENSEVISANAGIGPVALFPDSTAIIYFKIDDGILSSTDGGISTTVSVFAGKAGSPQSVTVQKQS
jgi:hypothetical protein